MPRWAQLQNLRPGTKLLLPVQVAAMSRTSITIAVLTVNESTGQLDPTPSGSFTIDRTTDQVTGQWAADPGSQPAWIQAEPLVVGDLLRGADGAIVMVRTIGLGDDGSSWSMFPDGGSPQTQEGFTKVGHVDL